MFQVRDLVKVIIPLRDVQLVEKNDNLVGGAVFPSSMVVTTKGKVSIKILLKVLCNLWTVYFIFIYSILFIFISLFFIRPFEKRSYYVILLGVCPSIRQSVRL